MERAHQAPLEDAEVALDGVGVDVAPHVLAQAVLDHAVRGELPAHLGVLEGFVGHEPRVRCHLLP